ncbi:restriction endonuclease subunit S [Chryseobacterium aahli]|uniref:restriction endonuclease subunit S n=1 Tax=Chryseobacterium aahli TaxID=1278643 RepID=UPI001F61EBF9|nr:restriction endonuclease subunit S [Chryseobacterium aahli]MCI3939370.1 restriction endonuclease subunit S [Chryseobacterium aahli]
MYNLPTHTDPNKIFIVNRSKLEGRFDPIYYNSVSNLSIVKDTNYKVFKLGEIVIFQRGRFGHRPRNDPRFFNGNYPFIQTGNIVEASQHNGEVMFTQTLNELGLGTSRLFEANTLVMTIAANIGSTAIINYKACFPDSLVALIPKVDFIKIEYLNFYLRAIQKYVEKLAPQAAQKNINNQQLRPLPIVVPPINIQQRIVDLYQSAYQQKQQKEAEAQQLLNSIDAYLLGELGITLPVKDNSLQNRIFTTSFSEITGSRFDPVPYEINTINLKNAIKDVNKKKFVVLPLKQFISQSVAGDWGIEVEEEYKEDEYTKCLVIRATEFDNVYNLKLDNSRVKYRLIKNEKIKKIDLQPNDLLIEKSGGSIDQPVGRIALITKEIFESHTLAHSNFIHKIRVDQSKINPQFLFYFLKVIHNVKLTETMQSQTNGIRNLIMQNYFNQNIILPKNETGEIDLQKQYEIARHIQYVRSHAKALQTDAKNILEQANKLVEQMILG